MKSRLSFAFVELHKEILLADIKNVIIPKTERAVHGFLRQSEVGDIRPKLKG